MLNSAIAKVFGTSNERAVKRLMPIVAQINALESAIQALSDDQLRAKTDEFRQRTGGGIGGDKWVAPLLPKDFAPPIDLRWPEYIQTVRGEEWWLPTPAVGSGAGERLHDGGTRD